MGSLFCSVPLLEGGEMARSSLAWRIPGTGEPGGLPSMGSQRDAYDMYLVFLLKTIKSCKIKFLSH